MSLVWNVMLTLAAGFPGDLSTVLPEARGAWAVEVRPVEAGTGAGRSWLVSYFDEPVWKSGACVASGSLVELHRETSSDVTRSISREDLALGYLVEEPSASCPEVDHQHYFMLDPEIDIRDLLAAVETVEKTQACLLGNEATHAECLGGTHSLHLRDALLGIDPRSPTSVAFDVDTGGLLELWYPPLPASGVDLLRCIVTRDEHGMKLYSVSGGQF